MGRAQRRIIIVVVVAVVVIAIAALVLPRTQAFAVKDITVAGATQLSPEEVKTATGITPGTPIGAVDMYASTPAGFTPMQVRQAVVLADLLAEQVLRLSLASATDAPKEARWRSRRIEERP